MPTQKTPLYEAHKKLNAQLVNFHDTFLPLRFSSEKEEHLAVRHNIGIFDVSHMGEFKITGPEAEDFLNYLFSNNITKLSNNQAQYTLMLNNSGKILEDLIIYKFNSQKFMICVNASNINNNWDYLTTQWNKQPGIELENISNNLAQIALQGPKSLELFKIIFNQQAPDKFCFNNYYFDNQKILVAHTGYTGELGLEIFCDTKICVKLWDIFLYHKQEYNILPCGLAARDSLRLEAGMLLHGTDISPENTPQQAKLMFAVDMNKKDFAGKQALLKNKNNTQNKLVGFRMQETRIPRHGYQILSAKLEPIGHVTSGGWPPTQVKPIGIGYVKNNYAKFNTKINIKIRNNLIPANITKSRCFIPAD